MAVLVKQGYTMFIIFLMAQTMIREINHRESAVRFLLVFFEGFIHFLNKIIGFLNGCNIAI